MKLFQLFFLVGLMNLTACDMYPGKGDPIPDHPDAATLKKAILKVAQRAQGECDDQDNDPRVRQVLDSLTQRLVALTPERSETEKLPQVLGVWQQIWSDAPFTSIPGACFDADEIYQVVFEDGFYYNIAEVTFPGQTSVGFTRGEYAARDSFLSVRFTNSISVFGVIEDFPDLTDASLRVESGEITPDFTRPTADEDFMLVNVYVDDQLRVVADNPQLSEAESIFVLERVDR